MKKIILSALIVATTVMAFESIQTRKLYPIKKDGTTLLKDNPVSLNFRTKDNGGPLDAIDAYQDGVGVYIGTVNPNMVIKENITNDLVFKYGESAKQNNVSLIDEVLYGANSTEEDKNKILSTIEDGKSCDDGNPESLNSMYINKICVADKTENTACDDQNAKTKDDKWVSGLCIGTPISIFAAELNLTPEEELKIHNIIGNQATLTKICDSSTYTSSSYCTYNKKHLLFIVRTNDWLLGGYTGEGHFYFVANGVETSSAPGGYIFNVKTETKLYPRLTGYALNHSSSNLPMHFGQGDFYITNNKDVYVAPGSINVNSNTKVNEESKYVNGKWWNQYTTYAEPGVNTKENIFGEKMSVNGILPAKSQKLIFWAVYQLN